MNNELTLEERYYISISLKNNLSISEIARKIGRHKSTVSREIKRNRGLRGYRYKQAHNKALLRRFTVKRHYKLTSLLKSHIIRYLEYGFSPEQIVGRFKVKKRTCVSVECIYQYIWNDKKQGGNIYSYLRRKNKRYRKRGNLKDSRGVIPNKKSIEERLEIVNNRLRIGDWEIDLVVGKDGSGYLVTATERYTNLNRIGFVKNKECKLVEDEVVRILSKEKNIFTITSDNGKEFANHENIAKRLGVEYYFANPYSSWERGTNENANGLIRQYFPKKEYFTVSESFMEKIKKTEKRLNNRPRKKIGFYTPNEIYLKGVVAIASWIQD